MSALSVNKWINGLPKKKHETKIKQVNKIKTGADILNVARECRKPYGKGLRHFCVLF